MKTLIFSAKGGYEYWAVKTPIYDGEDEIFEVFIGGDAFIGDADTLEDARQIAIDHYEQSKN